MSAIDEMQRDADDSSISWLLRQMKPRVLQIKNFTSGPALRFITEPVQPACIWGVITLMLEVIRDSQHG